MSDSPTSPTTPAAPTGKPGKPSAGRVAGMWAKEIAIVVVGALIASTLLRLFVALGGGRDKISVNVKAELAHNIRHGDRALLSVQGHWDMPDGDYPVRVLSAARKAADPDWVSVSLI